MRSIVERNAYWRSQAHYYVRRTIVLLLASFGVFHLYDENYALGSVILLGVPLYWFRIAYNKSPRVSGWIAYILAFYLLSIVCFMLFINQNQSAAIMWLMASPALSMLCLGSRIGLFISSLSLVLILLTLYYNDHLLSDHYSLRLLLSYLLTSAVCFFYEKNRENANDELNAALERIQTLEGLLPLCAWCSRKVRGKEGHWQSLESYISESLDMEVTHSICVDCSEQLKSSQG